MTKHQKGNLPVEESPVITPVKNTDQRVNLLPWVLLALFLSLMSAFTIMFIAYQWHQSTVERDLLAEKVNSMKTHQTQMVTKMAEVERVVEDNKQHLNKQLDKLQSNQMMPSSEWTLLKARSYLELAQMNAYWLHNDNEETSVLLGQADKLLSGMHEQSVLDIRKAIAEENTHIQSLDKIDVAGLLSQVDAAQNLTRSLPVKFIPEGGKQLAPGSTPHNQSSSVSTWRDRLKDSLQVLEKLVVIRRVDTDIQPLVSTAYAALIRDRIELILQETQLAIIQGNESLYQLTLKQAIEKAGEFFDTNASTTSTLLKQLKALQQHSVVQKRVEIGQALQLLNQHIENNQKHPQSNVENTEAGAPSI